MYEHTHASSLSLEPNKSVRMIERAGRPNVGVKRDAVEQYRQQDHTDLVCMDNSRNSPTYML